LNTKKPSGRPTVLSSKSEMLAKELYLSGKPIQKILETLDLSRATFFRHKARWNLPSLTVGVVDYLQQARGRYESFPLGLHPITFEIQFMKQLALRLGRKIRFFPVPFPNLLSGVHSGKYDLAIGLIGNSATREKLVRFSEPFNTHALPAQAGFVAKKGSVHSRPVPLVGLRVGVLAGSLNEDYAHGLGPLNQIVSFARHAGLHSALTKGLVDLSLDSIFVQKFFVSQNPEFSLVRDPVDLHVRPACAVSLSNEFLLNFLSEGILGQEGSRFVGSRGVVDFSSAEELRLPQGSNP
jgi:ABC-type amino acid transport substrate-binding protein